MFQNSDGAYEAGPWYASEGNLYQEFYYVDADVLEGVQRAFANSTATKKILFITTTGNTP
jgi:hypothetical protein